MGCALAPVADELTRRHHRAEKDVVLAHERTAFLIVVSCWPRFILITLEQSVSDGGCPRSEKILQLTSSHKIERARALT